MPGASSSSQVDARRKANDGVGRPAGMVPTAATPRVVSSPIATAKVASVSTTSGVRRPMKSACNDDSGRRPSTLRSGRPASASSPMLAMPSARVGQLVAGKACQTARNTSCSSGPLWVDTPSRAGSWVSTISSAAPLVNPSSTGRLRKLMNTPARSEPRPSSVSAEMAASTCAFTICCAGSPWPTTASALATISALTATGPTPT